LLEGTNAYTGGTYSATAGLIINASTGEITPSSSTPGIYTVTYTIPASAGCSVVPVTTSVTIATPPTAAINYMGTPYCAGAAIVTVTQTGTAGGTYSSTAGLVINAATGEVDLNSSTPGTYTVTYTIPANGGCTPVLVATSITINPTTIPVTGFSYATPVCISGTNPIPTVSGGFTIGGTYSSTAGLTINASTGEITLASSTVGTYTVTYTVPATVCDPVGSSTFDVTLTPSPIITLTSGLGTDAQTLCENTVLTGITYTVSNATGATVVGLPSGVTGTYAAGVFTISGTPTTPGSHSYTITTSGGCFPDAVITGIINVNSSPLAITGFSYSTPVCSNGINPMPIMASGFTTGGTYTSTAGLTLNSATGEITLATSTAGSYTVTYSVPASICAPAGSSTFDITITTASSATISYVGTPFCAGTGMVAVTQTGTLGGTYSSAVGLAINGTTGEIDLNASTPGAYTVTYEIAATGGCALFSTTTTIMINPITTPVTGFSYSTPVCSNDVNPAPTGVAGFTTGGTYSSTVGLTINTSTGEVDLVTSTPGSYTVTYVVPASVCGPVGSSSASITITEAPTATINYSGSPFCATVGSTTVTLSGTAAYTGGTYSAAAGLTINASTGEITPSSSTPGTYTVTYTIPASGGCFAVPVTTSVTITAAPTATISYAGAPYCATSSSGAVVLNGTGAYTGGSYSSTVGLSINASTGEITPSSSTPGTYTVTYVMS